MTTTQTDGGGADLGPRGTGAVGAACESLDDCEAGAQCVDGQCTEPECRGDDECANVVQGCVEGVCRIGVWDLAHAYVVVNVRMVLPTTGVSL